MQPSSSSSAPRADARRFDGTPRPCTVFAALLLACSGDLADRVAERGDAVDVSAVRPPESAPPAAGGVDRDASTAAPPTAPPPGKPSPTESSPARPAIPSPPALFLRGINLAGGEFGSALPGTYGRDYTFSTPSEVDYYLSKGMNTFRVGFKWERMQRAARGELDATYLRRVQDLVGYATSRGAHAILNPHNFARYYGKVVGSSAVPSGVFADFWRRLAAAFAANERVMFNLVNEPHDMPTEQWVEAANAAIAAIRSTGAKNVIVVPGNAWTGAHAWTSDHYGTPNSIAMLDVVDPGDNVLFEVHQYLDDDSSGTSASCVSPTIGRERLTAFVGWLRAHGRRGFLGEVAGGDDQICNVAVVDLLEYLRASADVIAGWAWWAGGPWWGEDYPFSLHPAGGVDRPQMALLLPFLRD